MQLKISDLTKRYGAQLAIDGINFSVKRGEILGFLGPNGAGKTTTMKIITGFIPPTEGTVTLDDLNIREHSLEIRKKIGYLPEHNPLYLDMYVHEFLRFMGKLSGVTSNLLKTRIAEIVEQTGLTREQHKKIGQLSKGYRQRVGLAQALIHEPPVLILDEPTTGLDPNQIIEIRSLIQKIGKERTVIFSTHILPEVEAIANRVVIINKGKIVADSPTPELLVKISGEHIIVVEFETAGFRLEVFQDFPQISKIVSVSATCFEFHTQADGELRKKIYAESVQQQIPILSLQKKTTSLVDIFQSVTN